MLQNVPNPKKYALHLPTVKYDCEDLVEVFGEDIVDALTLGEDMDSFCAVQQQCKEEEDLDAPDRDAQRRWGEEGRKGRREAKGRAPDGGKWDHMPKKKKSEL